jgi:alginate O-acetyltransferase complex protein AlgI
MQFTDPVYLFVVLPLACALLYQLTPRFGRVAGFGLLFSVSIAFYATWGSKYLLLLCMSFSVNFVASSIILALTDQQAVLRRVALYLGQLYNFGTLIWFKYRLVFLLFGGTERGYTLVDAAIPVGISFYTFQQAIFLVDAYHREASVMAYLGKMRTFCGKLRGYLSHAFFVTFFPHLLIGPIVYLTEFQPQVRSSNFGRVRRVNIEVGIALIIFGLFKKIVIADHLAPISDSLSALSAPTLIETQVPAAKACLAVLAYYAQLYFDFSGYSDLALGSARMLGIRFPINFYSPLKAVGIIDYYRRWNITLTRVIARFIYTPLSLAGTRLAVKARWPRFSIRIISSWLPLILNFEVISLWHGARLNFIVFGLVHGIWYVAETEVRASKPFKSWQLRTSGRMRAAIGRGIFFLLMPLTFALFRSATIPDYLHTLKSMFTGGVGVPSIKNAVVVLSAICIIWFLPNSMQILGKYRPGITTYANEDYTPFHLRFRWRPDRYWTAVMGAMLVSCLYYAARQPPFLYLGF